MNLGSCLMHKFNIFSPYFSANGSVLQKFLDETANMSPDDRAKHLENNKVGQTPRCYIFE